MNISFFIAKRLFSTKENNNNYTRPIISIAVLAISLSVSLMMISLIILKGFKNEIYNKVTGFGSHIKITKLTDNQSFENYPINFDDKLYSEILTSENVTNIQTVATKAGIIKNNEEILGVVLKGVGNDYDHSFLKSNLIEGNTLLISEDSLQKSNDIVVSESIARKIGCSVGDKLSIYIMDNPVRVRKLNVVGVYNTGLSEFDDLLVFGDIKQIQKLNNWNSSQIGAYEVSLKDLKFLEDEAEKIYQNLDFNLNTTTIKQSYPQIFDWLALQDLNIIVIITLMLIVGSVNMITALLIIILEKTQFIGLLKSLGASNKIIRRVFLYNSLYLISRGLFFGNLIALGFAVLQQKFSFISLDPEIYFMDTVPVSIDFLPLLYLNIGTIIICYVFLIVPSFIVSKISPIKALRFE
jgi:lipoprotein-releasing system permease protein